MQQSYGCMELVKMYTIVKGCVLKCLKNEN